MINTAEEKITMDSNTTGPLKIGAPTPMPEGAPRPRDWKPEYAYAEDSRRKSPGLAAFMSLMPGLGQVYVGYYQQGFINILVVASMITILTLKLRALTPMVALFMAFYWLYNIVDAGRRAAYYNRALAGLGPESLPEDMSLPGGKGSLLGGSLLVGFGLIFLLHTKFDMPLNWLEEWWPVGLLVVGGYLVYAHFREAGKSA
jgi:hypothetical protein